MAAPLCELQGPDKAPAHLRPAAAGILTLTSGELRITGCLGLDMFDGEVMMWGNEGGAQVVQ